MKTLKVLIIGCVWGNMYNVLFHVESRLKQQMTCSISQGNHYCAYQYTENIYKLKICMHE